MSHLSPERFAELADDTPSPMEAAHVASCGFCRAEIAAQRKLSRLAAGAQMTVDVPLSRFDALVPRLRAEGLIAPRAGRTKAWAWRAAATVTLLLGGAALGRTTAGMPVPFLPPTANADVPANPADAPDGPRFRSPDEAVQTLTSAQATYQNAAEYLAAQDTSAHFIGLNRGVYETRLAALDEIASATRAALYRAPQDPMLNQYYLATVSAREATLRQLRQAMPASHKLERY